MIGLDWLVDGEKVNFNGGKAIREARRNQTLKQVLVGLEIEGNIPADGAIVSHRRKHQAALVSAAIWSPLARRNIAIASLTRPYGTCLTEDLWVEIYALRERQYRKMMKRARVVPRPFITLDRCAATPPGIEWSGRTRYAAATYFYHRGEKSAEALEIYRICSRLDAENPQDVLRRWQIGAEWIERMANTRTDPFV